MAYAVLFNTMKISTCLIFITILLSCNKDPRDNIDGIYQIPDYSETPTLKVENYINRLFIDLISREPTDSEMVANIAFLRSDELSIEIRDSLAYRLQFDTTFSPGEGSYNEAYFYWFYEKAKGRFYKELSADEIFLEDINDLKGQALRDSLNGDTVAASGANVEINKLLNVINSRKNYQNGVIDFNDMMRYMIFNSVYDFVNMNTFNLIEASFDNLFYRYPIINERNVAFEMIENNSSVIFMGEAGSTKDDYVRILTDSREFYNGMVLWAYKSLLARDPQSLEASFSLKELITTKDYQKLERQLVTTDEYAQFTPTYR